MNDKLKGLAFATAFVVVAAFLYGMGLRHGKVLGENAAEARWATSLVRRHMAYWEIYPNGEKRLRLRYVPQVRKHPVIWVDENGKEILRQPIDGFVVEPIVKNNEGEAQ